MGDWLDLASGLGGNLESGYLEWRCLSTLSFGKRSEDLMRPIDENVLKILKILKVDVKTYELLAKAKEKPIWDYTPAEIQANIEFWTAARKRRHLTKPEGAK